MAKMKVAVVTKPGADFEIQEREIPQPGFGEVRIKVQACGICFSDHLLKDGLWPGIVYPRVPGHEVAGVVDEIGAGVTEWKKGDRVGTGWHGGHDFVCESCRRGDFIACKNEAVTGFTRDGGYQEYMLVRHEALARIPDDLDAAEAGPLLCAGVTTFNSLRHSGATSATWWVCRGSAVWGIWEFSSLRKLGIGSQPSGAGQRMRCWPRNWERLPTLIQMRQTRRRNCRSWEVRKLSWRPRRMRSRLRR